MTTTDADFMLAVLADGEWHSRDAIIAESMRDRGCGLTPHSRAATLRERGFAVECETRRTDKGRCVSFYRLVMGVLEDAPSGFPSRRDGNGASSSASIPAVGAAASDRGGALALFDTPTRGAYSEEAA